MPPLDLTSLLGGGAQAQVPADTSMLTGGGDTSPLGTVLARVRTNPMARGLIRGMGGPARAPAPSRGGAIAQGVMQGMDQAAAAAKQDAEAERLAALFGYNKAKDERDFNYKVARDKETAAETRRWHDLYKAPKPSTKKDALDLEKKRTDVWTKDPLFDELRDAKDLQGSRRLSPEAMADLQRRADERRKQIWSMGGGDDEAAATAPAEAPAEEAPAGPAIPLPEPRPPELTTRPEIDENGDPITGMQNSMPPGAAPAAPAAAGPPTGMPAKIRNRQTGEIRVWNPEKGTWLTETAPDTMPSLGSPM